MHKLYTEPAKFKQIAELVKTYVRVSEPNELLQPLLAKMNECGNIVTMAANVGHPFTKGKQLIYIHMAITEEGSIRIADFYNNALRKLFTDWEANKQPEGVSIKPSALQVRYNYYNYQGIWHQAMALECRGIHSYTTQTYILNLLNESW